MKDKNNKNFESNEDDVKNSEKCSCQNKECDCEKDTCSCGDGGCDCEKEEVNYFQMAQRIQAEFDNYRKRTTAEFVKIKAEGMLAAIETILPSLDSFKKASEIIKDEKVLDGIKQIKREIFNSLKQLGVEKIKAKSEFFDANLHNVIAAIPFEGKENGFILDEATSGYTLNGKVIRFSQVVIVKNGEKEI